MADGDGSATMECGSCRATIIPGDAQHLTIVSTNAVTSPGAAAVIPLPGQFLKRYELQNLLGSGTAGAVYMARHRESGAPRAIKIMLGKGADKERFQREARMLESIRHPSIIQMYEAGEMDGHPYLVLEYAAGGSLRKRLKTGPRYSMREAVELTIPMLEGLQACHDKGIIHRDLKPDNILLAGPTTAKIADLGVALLESANRLTATGALVGTPLYMAPEQLQADDVDVTADLHSVGLMLYEMLSGDLPFKGRNLSELLQAKLTHVPPPIETLVPELPAGVAAVLQAALERSPAKRPRNATEFAEELERGLAGQPSRRGKTPAKGAPGLAGSGSSGALKRTVTGAGTTSGGLKRPAGLEAGLGGTSSGSLKRTVTGAAPGAAAGAGLSATTTGALRRPGAGAAPGGAPGGAAAAPGAGVRARNIQAAGIAAVSVAILAGAFLLRPGPTPVESPSPRATGSTQLALLPTATPSPGSPGPGASPGAAVVSSPASPAPASVPAYIDTRLGTYPPEGEDPEAPPLPLRIGLQGARVFGRCTLPDPVLVPQRFTQLFSVPGAERLAGLWTVPEHAIVGLLPRTLEVRGAAPMPAGVRRLAVDPAGEHVYASTEQGDLFDVTRTAGKPSRRLAIVGGAPEALAALPGGRVLVAVAGAVEVRAAGDGSVLNKLACGGAVSALAGARDGALVAAGLASGDLCLFAPDAKKEQRRVALGHAIAEVRFNLTGQQVIACDGTDALAVVDVASGQVTRAFRVEAASLRRFALSDDGALLATATDKAVQLWDWSARSRQALNVPALPVQALSFAERDQCLAVAVDLEESTSVPTTELQVYDLKTGALVKRADSIGVVRRCAYAADGRTLLTSGDHPPGGEQPGLIGWDTGTAAARFSFRAPTSYVLASDFASRTFFMAQGGLEQRDLADGHVVKTFAGAPVMIEVSPDDARLAVLTDAGEAHLLDRKSAKVLWQSPGGYSALHLGKEGKLVTAFKVIAAEKGARPQAVAEVWDPAKNAVVQSQKLEFLGSDGKTAVRPVVMMPGGRPAFGSLATQALAGLPETEQSHIVRESLPLSEASQVTLHRAGDHVFALRMDKAEPGPARGVLHWRIGHGESPDVWMPERVSPFALAELTSLAASPDGRRLAVGTSMAAILELDIDKIWGANPGR